MKDNMNFMECSILQWIWIIIGAFLIGFSKTGINGVATLVISILANILGGKNSTGILLPILNIAPNTIIVGISLMPMIAIGAFLGSMFIQKVNEKIFHKLVLFMTAFAALRLLM